MTPKITVIGSSNTDMVIQVDRMPKPGETVLGGKFMKAAGGKGANQAVAAARAGGDVTLVARVGSDTLGEEAVRGFREEGMHVQFVGRDPKNPSGVALIFVAKNGENSIAVASGANSQLSPKEISKARKAIVSSNTLLMQLEIPLETVEAAVTVASTARKRIILNPAPARKLPSGLLRFVTILTPNETEAEILTGIAVANELGAAKAAKRLHAQGVRTVIVTLGARGAFVSDPDFSGLVPGLKVKAVDTTAAGDVFNGALAVALSEGKAVQEAVRFANAAAAISVTRMGAQPSAPTRRQVQSLLSGKKKL